MSKGGSSQAGHEGDGLPAVGPVLYYVSPVLSSRMVSYSKTCIYFLSSDLLVFQS